MENHKVLEEIKNIYQIVSGQIAFIESKNGALIVFNVAMITVMLSSNQFITCLAKGALVGFSISCIIGLRSFSPNRYECKRIKAIDFWNDSLIYFRNIAKYDARNPKQYVDDLCISLKENFDINKSDLVYSYANEIIVLSKIIVIKHRSFMQAGLVTVWSIAVLIVDILMK